VSPIVLKIATACLFDDHGRILVVRKRGSRFFMLPGGKIEPEETSLQALQRELHEELDLRMEESQLQSLGHVQAHAANEPDHWVEADVFVGRLACNVKCRRKSKSWIGWGYTRSSWTISPRCFANSYSPILRERLTVKTR
jgi:8-oxo-dGTP diphosphatase